MSPEGNLRTENGLWKFPVFDCYSAVMITLGVWSHMIPCLLMKIESGFQKTIFSAMDLS